MRILLLNYEFPPLGGGAGNASAQIARCLALMGVDVAVVTSRYTGLAPFEVKDGYAIYRVPVLRRYLDHCSIVEMATFVASAAFSLRSIVGTFSPDALIVFFGIPTGPLGLLARKLFGLPYILSLRGGDVPGFLEGELGRSHRLVSTVTKIVWDGASAVVANSVGLAMLAQKSYRKGKVQMIPNGVDTSVFYPPEHRCIPDKALRMIFVARLVEQKGAKLVVQAMPEAARRLNSPLTLDIIGKGPEEYKLRSLVRDLGLGQAVCFSGWLERNEIAERMRKSDLFVLPSYEEGMPNVVLEGMACGLPVLATDIYGVKGLVEDHTNGILVPPGDVQAITDAIVAFGSSPETTQAMGRQSLEIVKQYDWMKTAGAYLRLAEGIV